MPSRSLSETTSPDQRYIAIHDAIKTGSITRFAQLLDYLPESEFAALLDLDSKRLGQLIRDPELMQVKQLATLAGLFNVDYRDLLPLLIRHNDDNNSASHKNV
ncbi:hypothetical protein Q4E93_15845 [Flavitalea sp. BT771]|uniref:hypothetical protein n=1 Tax=Flavitalea sp. BT771 TaxID=3063329 RepID=UPI0026E319D1|nr:hypothetical protein [Flavitalea sp. BT771]MDO6432075.1 hypothetical protein [Flavitalea sp. BT771]MDV6220984.1 hypothetical protein [Flavitalea sp. BT771]